MPEYGDYKKEIKTLGDLRTFVNETLKDIEDDYTFDIDDDFMGVDIVLIANCDVSYSEKSFYWTANVNYATEIEKVVEDRIKAKRKIKALEIIKEKVVDICELKICIDEYDDSLYQYNKRMNIKLFKLTQEEFNLLKGILNDEQ